MCNLTYVDASFPLTSRLSGLRPSGYCVAAGIKRAFEKLGLTNSVQRFIDDRTVAIRIDENENQLVIRQRLDSLDLFFPLVGFPMNWSGKTFSLGLPSVQALRPFHSLYSSFVTIKGFEEWPDFLHAVYRQIPKEFANHIVVQPLHTNLSENRKVIRIKTKRIVGFSTSIECRNSEASLWIQSRGVGGRRHFGAGIPLAHENRLSQN